MVSTFIVVRIRDVVKALTKTPDIGDMIMDVAASSSVDSVVIRKWSDLTNSFAEGDIEEELKEIAQKLLNKYGVKVVSARFTDYVLQALSSMS